MNNTNDKENTMTKAKKVRNTNIYTHIKAVLADESQPLTSNEVCAKLKQTGKKYHPNYVYSSLKEMVDGGGIAARPETDEERELRAGVMSVRGIRANLYSARGKAVPTRTKQTVIAGKVLRSGIKSTGIKTSSSTVSAMIDLLVQERTMKLETENADLRDKLKAISSITQA
jgi:hypothetical protein